MFVDLAKRVLSHDPRRFACVYTVFVFIMAAVFNTIHVPATFLSDSKNFLNVWLFKSAFNYTIVALLIFACAAHASLHRGHTKRVLVPVARLLFTVLLYSLAKTLIEVAGTLWGVCENHPALDNQHLSCTTSGYVWHQFRVSGHAFSLPYAMLLIIEETAVFKWWECATDAIAYESEPEQGVDKADRPQGLDRACGSTLAPFVRTLYVALAVWMLALHFNMLVTIVYFHELLQKAGAAVLAALMWFVTYGLVFKLLPRDDARPSFAKISTRMYQSVEG